MTIPTRSGRQQLEQGRPYTLTPHSGALEYR
jgi:hypothetical protein